MSDAREILRRIAQNLLDEQRRDVELQGGSSTTPTPIITTSTATAVPLSSTTQVSSEISGFISDFAGLDNEGDSEIKRIIKKVLKMSQEELCARPENKLNEDCHDINTVAGQAGSPVSGHEGYKDLWVFVGCMLVAGGLVLIVVSVIIFVKRKSVPAGKSAAKQQYSTRVQQFVDAQPGALDDTGSVNSSLAATAGSDIRFGLNSAERHSLLVSGYLMLHREELQARGVEVPAHLYDTVEEANSRGIDVPSILARLEDKTVATAHGIEVPSTLSQLEDKTVSVENSGPSLLYRTVDHTGEVSASYGGDLIQVIKKNFFFLNGPERLLLRLLGNMSCKN